MNAAYLMLTTVWLAGADPAQAEKPATPPAAQTAPAPIVHGSIHGGCNGCTPCDSCDCDSGKGGFGSRLRGLFRRKGNDCDSCAPVTCCQPTCDSCCDDNGGGGLFGRLRGLFRRNNDDCCEDDCGRPGLFDRIKARFRKGDDCCQPACDSCGGTHAPHGAPGTPGVRPEPIGAPKEMPKGTPGTTGTPGTIGAISTPLNLTPVTTVR